MHRVHLASDLHLGAPNAAQSREREIRFIQWLERSAEGTHHATKGPATEIHLVGDLFDFWFEYKRAVPKGGVRLLGAIARIADSGIPVHYHVGNHDLWTFGYLESELGVHLHREPIFSNYDGLNVCIGHGDGLGPGDYSYKRIKKIFTNPILQRAFKAIHPDVGMGIASYFSRNSRAQSATEDAEFAGADKEWLWHHCQSILQNKEVDCFIFGHRHKPLDLEVPHPKQGPSSRYINLGDWITHFTSARIEEGMINLDRHMAD